MRCRGVDRVVRAALRASRRRGRKRRHAGRSPAAPGRTGQRRTGAGRCPDRGPRRRVPGRPARRLLMYLDQADAVALLVRLGQLAPRGRIILRESGVRAGVEVQTGTYQVAYRSLQEYEAMAAEADLRVVAVERNRGYAHMEIAVALVNLARRWPPLARRDAAV